MSVRHGARCTGFADAFDRVAASVRAHVVIRPLPALERIRLEALQPRLGQVVAVGVVGEDPGCVIGVSSRRLPMNNPKRLPIMTADPSKTVRANRSSPRPLRREESPKASDTFIEPLIRRREAPADEPFALGSEGAARRETQFRVTH
jgi:hypothetical protein